MKILLVEDHPIIVSGCQLVFAQHPNIVFRDAATLATARQELRKHQPDVTIVDINLPDGSGLDFVRELTESNIASKVIVFSMLDEPCVVKKALNYGARGFVSKFDKPDTLLDAVGAVSRGETWLSDEVLQKVFMGTAPRSDTPRLTTRQKNVLKCLGEGRYMSEIAGELNISSNVVYAECAAVRKKLKARTNAEMVAIAMKLQLN
ncbi:LuxR family transcriptional regulator [Hyphomicrobium denitrificans 1NES1]|uniref:LuxR family transcriptional regulator n=1 Tax=Hyphomicrobium denitrificans 1NES1 TaxID=670307 RepID=N0B1W2_9HYPH|nr:response regulator transcription factor [Hyphomicrobium denitrificans]AGK56933.1 LuxR family transcriptional regulator [Hyphomicrobium denitrificans 1NES1]